MRTSGADNRTWAERFPLNPFPLEWGSTFFLRSIMHPSDLQDTFDYFLRENKLIMIKHFHFVDEVFWMCWSLLLPLGQEICEELQWVFSPHAYGWGGSETACSRCFQVTHGKFVTLYVEVQDEFLGLCTLLCSFPVLAVFVLAVWVSNFSSGFSSLCFNTEISHSDWLISWFLSFDFPGRPPEEKTEVWSWRSGQAVRYPGYWYSSW